MLGSNQSDFMAYHMAFKGNYRKGVHRLEAILANPTYAAEFAGNVGGVSVVLGVPIGKEDKNSETLLAVLLESDVADQAALTWLGRFFVESGSWDELLGDENRCKKIMDTPLMWRAVEGSGVVNGKIMATLAGLDPSDYADMEAVVSSSTAMTAIIETPTALDAVVSSQTAMTAVAASQTAMTAIIETPTALDAVVSSQAAMTAVAASQTAMTAIIETPTALDAVVSSQTAMAAVAASQTAMTAVAASSVAVEALVASPLCSVYNPVNSTYGRTDSFTGSGILIRVCNYQVSGSQYKIDGGSAVKITGQRADIVKAYQSSLEVYWVCYSDTSDPGIYRIVLSGT